MNETKPPLFCKKSSLDRLFDSSIDNLARRICHISSVQEDEEERRRYSKKAEELFSAYANTFIDFKTGFWTGERYVLRAQGDKLRNLEREIRRELSYQIWKYNLGYHQNYYTCQRNFSYTALPIADFIVSSMREHHKHTIYAVQEFISRHNISSIYGITVQGAVLSSLLNILITRTDINIPTGLLIKKIISDSPYWDWGKSEVKYVLDKNPPNSGTVLIVDDALSPESNTRALVEHRLDEEFPQRGRIFVANWERKWGADYTFKEMIQSRIREPKDKWG